MLEDMVIPYVPSQNQALAEWKREGKKALGYFCAAFPKEIIYAAGILPVRIVGTSKAIEEGDVVFCRFACYLSRSSVDLVLKGDLDLLDGTVFSYTCDVMHYLAPRWQQLFSKDNKFWYYLTRPARSDTEGAVDFFRLELAHFREELEKHFRTSISNEALQRSIDVYNESRTLLRKIDALKKQGYISSVEALKMNFMSMLSPPDLTNKALRNFIGKCEMERQAKESGRIKIFVSGATLPNTELFELIEEEGGVVIDNDLCVGSRYIRGEISSAQDPLVALAKYYLADDELNRQCSSMLTEGRHDERRRYIENARSNHGIDGIIFAIPYNCDKHYWDVIWFVNDFKASNFPALTLQQEGNMKSEAIRNRVAAFIETVRERGK